MHKLIIHELGPIEHCELECSHFMALTGFQASGKSTIAKAIYFFRTIKDDILDLAKTQALNSIPGEAHTDHKNTLKKQLENHLRDKFLRTFGSSWGMSDEMSMEYHFSSNCTVKLSLVDGSRYAAPNYIWITFSEDLKEFLLEKDKSLPVTPLGIPEDLLKQFQEELYQLFHDSYTVVYIPAGRSMITLLSQQISYLYATMDDVQKRSLDNCTKDYLERTLRLKSEFSEGLQGLISRSTNRTSFSKEQAEQALKLIKNILRGSYRYSNGEEQIILDNGTYVKINLSSSGQQECVWILNLLFYYLLRQNPILFIIEEPESHLFPESQKYITELIALVNRLGHSVLLTTHSPYVLGTLNNLLYAHTIPQAMINAADKIIPRSLWIDEAQFDAWFVKEGSLENCMDPEIHMIQNEKIDQISKVINEDFDRLLELQSSDEESVVS